MTWRQTPRSPVRMAKPDSATKCSEDRPEGQGRPAFRWIETTHDRREVENSDRGGWAVASRALPSDRAERRTNLPVPEGGARSLPRIDRQALGRTATGDCDQAQT